MTGIVVKRESPYVSVNGSGRESVEDGGGGGSGSSVAVEQLRAEIEQYKQFIRYKYSTVYSTVQYSTQYSTEYSTVYSIEYTVQ